MYCITSSITKQIYSDGNVAGNTKFPNISLSEIAIISDLFSMYFRCESNFSSSPSHLYDIVLVVNEINIIPMSN